MYINGLKLRMVKLFKSLELFFGIAGLILFGATYVYVILEGGARDDVVNTFLFLTIFNILLILNSVRIAKSIEDVYFYARYFEGDLDGKIKPSQMVGVIGKSEERINSQLKKFKKKGYMKNYKIVKNNNETIIELESIVTKCQCKNCGAVIDKKVYFTGTCPYCGGIDVFAKQLKNEEVK